MEAIRGTIKLAGLGLKSLGMNRGDVVSIISENLPEWLYTDMGTLGVGGITNGIYTTDSAKQVEYIVNDSRTRFFFAENEEQLDKILVARPNCPSLVKIIVYDMEGLLRFSDDQVISFDQLLERGAEYERSNPEAWERELGLSKPEDLAVLIYTSGTTGPAKGAMICHRNVMFHIANADVFCESVPGDELLSFLPLCHIAERKFSVFYPLMTGAVVNFIESSGCRPRECARGFPDVVLRGAPDLGEVLFRRHDQDVGRDHHRKGRVRCSDRRREGEGATHPRGRGDPVASERRVLDRRQARPSQYQDLSRLAPHAHSGNRCGTDLARSHQLVSRLGAGNARDLRSDREYRHLHGDA